MKIIKKLLKKEYKMTLNLEPSQHAKLVKVCADSLRNTTRLLTAN